MVALWLTPAACAAGAATDPGSGGHTPHTGVLTGAIISVGGPSPRPGQHPRPNAGLVRVFGARGKEVARTRVRAGHHFRFVLAAGRYEVTAGQGVGVNSPFACHPSRARVRVGRTARVNVYTGCGIP
jgi:hypothetical protein